MKTVSITVTRKHCEEGIAANCSRCPIALAAAERFPQRQVSVGYTYLTVDGFVYRLPWKATQFIEQYDEGGTGLVPENFTDLKLDLEPTEIRIHD